MAFFQPSATASKAAFVEITTKKRVWASFPLEGIESLFVRQHFMIDARRLLNAKQCAVLDQEGSDAIAAQKALIRTAEARLKAYLAMLGMQNRGLYVYADGDAVFFAPQDASAYDKAAMEALLTSAKTDFDLDLVFSEEGPKDGIEECDELVDGGGFAFNCGGIQSLKALRDDLRDARCDGSIAINMRNGGNLYYTPTRVFMRAQLENSCARMKTFSKCRVYPCDAFFAPSAAQQEGLWAIRTD